jgi:hypothetical protein
MTGLVIATLAAIVALVGAGAWVRHTDSDVAFGACLLLGIVAFVLSMVCAVSYFERRSCEQKADGLDRNSEWGIVKGCLVHTDNGQLVPLDNLRFNESGEVTE